MTEALKTATNRLVRAFATMPEVNLAFLFGSRARGIARHDSDFDIAVLVDQSLVTDAAGRGRTLRQLAGRLGREVASQRLDLVLLNDAPPLLRQRVLRDGILLHQRSEEDRVRFAVTTIREYQDGSIRRQSFTRSRVARLKKGMCDGGPGDLLEKARSAARLLGEVKGVS